MRLEYKLDMIPSDSTNLYKYSGPHDDDKWAVGEFLKEYYSLDGFQFNNLAPRHQAKMQKLAGFVEDRVIDEKEFTKGSAIYGEDVMGVLMNNGWNGLAMSHLVNSDSLTKEQRLGLALDFFEVNGISEEADESSDEWKILIAALTDARLIYDAVADSYFQHDKGTAPKDIEESYDEAITDLIDVEDLVEDFAEQAGEECFEKVFESFGSENDRYALSCLLKELGWVSNKITESMLIQADDPKDTSKSAEMMRDALKEHKKPMSWEAYRQALLLSQGKPAFANTLN